MFGTDFIDVLKRNNMNWTREKLCCSFTFDFELNIFEG